EDFLAVDRVLSGLNYVLLAPLNLWTMQVYYPMEQVNLHQMLQRNLSNTAMLGVLWGNRKQDGSFIHGKLVEISHRLEHSYITRRLRRIKNSILKRLKG
ncbi:MAG: hypothetical protein J1E28_01965, partial [Helicobacter sp.]|uniref:hypothetical protein n=1 Tax=Helicobacter sp. TaxID=218 RepID=UPI0025BEB46F